MNVTLRGQAHEKVEVARRFDMRGIRRSTDLSARCSSDWRIWMVMERGCTTRACSGGQGKTSHGPIGSGTAYFDSTRMGTFSGQITDYQPPSRIGFRETLRLFGRLHDGGAP